MTTETSSSTFPVCTISHSNTNSTPKYGYMPTTVYLDTVRSLRINRKYIDYEAKIATFKKDNVVIYISNFDTAKINQSVGRLFDTILMAFTNYRSSQFAIDINYLMDLYKLKDKKSFIEQLERDLIFLRSITITYTTGNTIFKENNTHSWNAGFELTGIFRSARVDRGKVFIILEDFFYNRFLKCPVKPFPIDSLRISLNTNPNCGDLLAKLSSHYNINYYKKNNRNRISLKKLLAACPNIPTEIEASPHHTEKILKPFERDMNKLEERGILKWEYGNAQEEALTEGQNQNQIYKVLKEVLIYFDFVNYPERPPKKKKVKKSEKTKTC